MPALLRWQLLKWISLYLAVKKIIKKYWQMKLTILYSLEQYCIQTKIVNDLEMNSFFLYFTFNVQILKLQFLRDFYIHHQLFSFVRQTWESDVSFQLCSPISSVQSVRWSRPTSFDKIAKSREFQGTLI